MTTRIAVAGIAGRMGREVAAAAAEDPAFILSGGVVRPGSAAAGVRPAATDDPNPTLRISTDLGTVLAGADVLIDFTSPEATVAHAAACAEAGVALVAGATGLGPDHLARLHEASKTVPVFYAPNMSPGIAALLAALPALVRALADHDVEVVETHHRHKADAPSGTALALADAIARARGADLDRAATFGRRGPSPRQPDEIGIHAIRAGGNAGEHTILLANEGEEIRLTHRAYGRRAFALGALRAARFLAGRPPGFYGMTDLDQGAGSHRCARGGASPAR